MQFFLYEVVARIVAAYLCYDCGRNLWFGLAERKIAIFNRPDLLDWSLDWFSDWSTRIVHRDTQPIQYWMQIGIQVVLVLSCFGVAILGWWHPDS
jgi:hypothetical protein